MKNLVSFNEDGTVNIHCKRSQGPDTLVTIDLDDLKRVASVPGTWGVGYTSGQHTMYCSTLIGRQRVYLHRFIANAPAGWEVDHISAEGLDNTRRNLRICTRKENAEKMRISDKPKPGKQLPIKGVRQVGTKYGVQFKGDWYGTFGTAGEAQAVYEALRKAENLRRTGRE